MGPTLETLPCEVLHIVLLGTARYGLASVARASMACRVLARATASESFWRALWHRDHAPRWSSTRPLNEGDSAERWRWLCALCAKSLGHGGGSNEGDDGACLWRLRYRLARPLPRLPRERACRIALGGGGAMPYAGHRVDVVGPAHPLVQAAAATVGLGRPGSGTWQRERTGVFALVLSPEGCPTFELHGYGRCVLSARATSAATARGLRRTGVVAAARTGSPDHRAPATTIEFEGEWAYGEVEGQSRCMHDGALVACGQWSSSELSGACEFAAFNLRLPFSSFFPSSFCYSGGVMCDLPHGHGTAIYADGSTYRGQWRGGLWHGFGERVSAWARYVGHFSSGRSWGYGVLAVRREPFSFDTRTASQCRCAADMERHHAHIAAMWNGAHGALPCVLMPPGSSDASDADWEKSVADVPKEEEEEEEDEEEEEEVEKDEKTADRLDESATEWKAKDKASCGDDATDPDLAETYCGEMRGGMACGRGRMAWHDGSHHTGYWHEGHRSGYGTAFDAATGETWSCTWDADVPMGFIDIKRADGSRTRGNFSSDDNDSFCSSSSCCSSSSPGSSSTVKKKRGETEDGAIIVPAFQGECTHIYPNGDRLVFRWRRSVCLCALSSVRGVCHATAAPTGNTEATLCDGDVCTDGTIAEAMDLVSFVCSTGTPIAMGDARPISPPFFGGRPWTVAFYPENRDPPADESHDKGEAKSESEDDGSDFEWAPSSPGPSGNGPESGLGSNTADENQRSSGRAAARADDSEWWMGPRARRLAYALDSAGIGRIIYCPTDRSSDEFRLFQRRVVRGLAVWAPDVCRHAIRVFGLVDDGLPLPAA